MRPVYSSLRACDGAGRDGRATAPPAATTPGRRPAGAGMVDGGADKGDGGRMNTMDRKKPSEENRELARYTAGVFGGTCKVQSYDHDYIELSMPILSCPDRPSVGATAYATVGLSDYPMFHDGKEFPARLELVGACDSDDPVYANILVAAAFCVIRSQ